MPVAKDLTGLRFGRLTVMFQDKSKKHRYWHCQCDCGEQKVILGKNLTRKKKATHSCGCLARETSAENNRQNARHGMSKTRTHSIWRGVLGRTLNPNNSDYKSYGGRGITVDRRWLVFENFLEDMGEAPENLELDRIDNDGGYSKQNCRWVTRKAQSRNTRRTIWLQSNNERVALSTLVEEHNLPYQKTYYHVVDAKRPLLIGDKVWELENV